MHCGTSLRKSMPEHHLHALLIDMQVMAVPSAIAGAVSLGALPKSVSPPGAGAR